MSFVEKIKCAMGKAAAYSKFNGTVVDEAALNKELNTTHSRASYGAASNRYNAALPEGMEKGLGGKFIKFLDGIGIPARKFHGYTAEASSILDEKVINAGVKVYSDFLHEITSKNPEYKDIRQLARENRALWKSKYATQFKKIGEDNEASVKPINKDYFANYIKDNIQGKDIYGPGASSNPAVDITRNLTSKFIDLNPALPVFHTVSFTPKALAYAIEKKGPVEGFGAIMKGMADFVKASGGNIFKKIPELERLGVYGLQEPAGKGHFGLHRLVDITEHPIRGLTHFIGEAIEPGGSAEALRKIPFVYQMGNTPASTRDANGFLTLGMMRYVIGSAQFYTRLAMAAPHSPNALMALAAFSAMNAIQTGSKSVIPAILYPAVPTEMRDQLDQFDDATGLNVFKHVLGTDLSKEARPLAFPSVGVPLAMANEAIKGTGSAVSKASEDAYQGDALGAATRIMQAVFNVGQLTTYPWINIATKKAMDTVAGVVAGEVNADPMDIGADYLKRAHIYVEPTPGK